MKKRKIRVGKVYNFIIFIQFIKILKHLEKNRI
jgi:hypothetical protein